MFLRSLTIKGFKSFADKTTLEFTPGISVIVGPNGSGKSNISDAIAWVLGEQGPRALRGAQMADVIFAGSPARPALGMAEVHLVIDNTAGLIPVPASEIEISRAIYRSGDSEYRLGGRPCRLMDILELLSDTGVGRTLHTLIGQGHLEDVLTARPEERRRYVEEAAGIAKHRRRRERAASRLASLEGDLLRLQDLASELRRQLKPLKQQADLAQRHEALTEEAERLARLLAAARLRDLLGERDRRRPLWERAEARQAEARARLSSLDEEIARLDGDRSAAEAAAREAEVAREEVTRGRSEAEAALRTALREEGRARERLVQATNASGRLLAMEDELARAEAAAREVDAALALRAPELEAAEQAFRTAEHTRQDAEDRRRASFEAAADRRATAEALRQAAAVHRGERERLSGRRAEVEEALAAATSWAASLESEIERLDELEAPLSAEDAALEQERTAMAERIATLEAEEKGLLARQDVVEARRAELSESPGAAFLRRRGAPAIGLLRDLVEAPPDLRAALKAALGPFADAVVYDSSSTAVAAAGAAGASGVTLAVASGEPAAASAAAGPERRLLDLIRVDGRVRPLVGRLLADVFLVSNLAEASARHGTRPEATFVTTDGTVLGPGYIRVAAEHDARLEAIRRDSAAIERELASTRRGLRETRHVLEGIATRATEVRGELARLDQEITSAAEAMGSARMEAAGLERERGALDERIAAAEESERLAEARLVELPETGAEPAELPPVPQVPIHLRVEVESLRRELRRVDEAARGIRAEMAALADEDPVALRSLLKDAERVRAEAEERLRSLEDRAEPAEAEARAALEAVRLASERLGEANAGWRAAAAELDRIREEHEQEDRVRVDLERRIGDAERTLADGHGVAPADVLAALDAEDTVADLQRRSDLVARRLGLLGRVNLLASGELESLQERHDFLVRELEDVRSARRDLERVIEEVDRQMAELFEAAFRDVAREFSTLFAHLFPGGEGRLTLLDPTDPLTSGIEVEARPGRKKVKRLSLLSGGERSLAALAFLFAIFRARPSPFYLMDEVEAALDDVNLHRFLEIVKEFARDSQILVVTHQKRTMETADVLYGVSMSQDGSSSVISQRLNEVVDVEAG